MGTFYSNCAVSPHSDRSRRAEIVGMLVDTGSELTWIAEPTLKALGVEPEKRATEFLTADGRSIVRDVGFAIIYFGERFTIDEVVFAQPGDLQILGARTLEGLNLAVDPARKRLVSAGPLPAAVSAR